MITILNRGPVPVRVAGRWLQSGETLDVDPTVAGRLMAANPDVVEPGKEPEKPTEDLPAVEPEPENIEPGKFYEVTGESPFRDLTKRKK